MGSAILGQRQGQRSRRRRSLALLLPDPGARAGEQHELRPPVLHPQRRHHDRLLRPHLHDDRLGQVEAAARTPRSRFVDPRNDRGPRAGRLHRDPVHRHQPGRTFPHVG